MSCLLLSSLAYRFTSSVVDWIVYYGDMLARKSESSRSEDIFVDIHTIVVSSLFDTIEARLDTKSWLVMKFEFIGILAQTWAFLFLYG